jgi:hypothetical protein
VSPVKYELGSYIPEDDILHSNTVETSNLTVAKSFLRLINWHRAMKMCREWMHSSTVCCLVERWGEWSASRPGHFTPREEPHPSLPVTHWIWDLTAEPGDVV